MIALLLEDYLRELGFSEIVHAASIAQGLAQAEGGEFDFALLDVNLGGKRSDRIADILLRRGVPFAFSTGYGSGAVMDAHADVPVLTKPTQLADLSAVLSHVLPGR